MKRASTIRSSASTKLPSACRILAKIAPASDYHIEDVHNAGGVSAIINELLKKPARCTATALPSPARRCARMWKAARSRTKTSSARWTIRTANKADWPSCSATWRRTARSSKSAPSIQSVGGYHKGPAICFDSQEEALHGIANGKVKEGHVVVIRYEGPKGGPGMPEMLAPTSQIVGMGLGAKVGLITDGRFSGASRGISIGHISPEAAEGGPIAFVQDGDIIELDLNNRTIELLISDEEMERRKANGKDSSRRSKRATWPAIPSWLHPPAPAAS